MRKATNNGQAAIELVAMAPLLAALVILGAQLTTLFNRSLKLAGRASAEAASMVRAWEDEHESRGFARPCLERMQAREVALDDGTSPLGFGRFHYRIPLKEQVAIAHESLCVPW